MYFRALSNSWKNKSNNKTTPSTSPAPTWKSGVRMQIVQVLLGAADPTLCLGPGLKIDQIFQKLHPPLPFPWHVCWAKCLLKLEEGLCVSFTNKAVCKATNKLLLPFSTQPTISTTSISSFSLKLFAINPNILDSRKFISCFRFRFTKISTTALYKENTVVGLPS